MQLVLWVHDEREGVWNSPTLIENFATFVSFITLEIEDSNLLKKSCLESHWCTSLGTGRQQDETFVSLCEECDV